MSSTVWLEFEALLNEIFDDVNTNNGVEPPSVLWTKHQRAITSLSTSSNREVAEQFVTLSTAPNLISPKPVEIARLLSLLKQRRAVTSNGRQLVGKIRAAIAPRERPPFSIAAATLTSASRVIAQIGQNAQYSEFQIEGWTRVLHAIEQRDGLVIAAPTGAGKSEVFMLPIVYSIGQHLANRGSASNDPHFVMLYPRVELLKDQLERVLRYVHSAESTLLNRQGTRGIVVGFQFAGVGNESQKTLQNRRIFENGFFKVVERCPACRTGRLQVQPKRNRITPLRCTNSSCRAEFKTTISKQDHVAAKPHILVTTSESLNRFYLTPRREHEDYLRSITGIIFDEAHLYFSLEGAHLYNLINNIEDLQRTSRQQRIITKIASSATITSPGNFAAKLFYGNESPPVPVHDAQNYTREHSGIEVLYFLQSPSGDKSPVPSSTMIQSVMGVGHGLFSDQPEANRERAILFTDSVDNANRFQGQIQDAESGGRLWEFRTVLANILYDGSTCPNTNPLACPDLYLKGECWRGIIGGAECTRTTQLREHPLQINCVSSKTSTDYRAGEVVVATSSLEVGVDDSRIKATFHYRPPRTVFSFIQRRGRSGRRRGDVAYSIMVLGNEASDQFYLYRRNRLLSSSSYELPLNAQNRVVGAMHETLASERARMKAFSDREGPQRGTLSWFYETLLRCPEVNRQYATTLARIRTYNSEAQQKALLRWIREEMVRYEGYLNVLWTLQEIENQSPASLRANAEEIKNLIEQFVGGNRALEPMIQQRVQNLLNDFNGLIVTETDSDVISHLSSLQCELGQIWAALRTRAVLGISLSLSRGFYDFFRTLSKIDKHWLFNSEPDVIKPVLQAFFYLGLETRKDSAHQPCRSCVEYFVPDTFFQQVKPLVVELRRAGPTIDPQLEQESISDLATMFFPYKTIYRYFGSRDLSVIETSNNADQVRVVAGIPVVTVQLHGIGLRSGTTFMPQRVAVKSVPSDEESNGFVKICQACYSVYGINRNLRCHGQDLLPVKLYATPIIERIGRPSTDNPPESFSRTLDFLDLEGDTTVSGSDVSATRLRLEGPNTYTFTRYKFEFQALYDVPVSYRIPTHGIRWNLEEIVNCVMRDSVLQGRLANSGKAITRDLVLHTAVHMLYKAISSISGVNQEVLEYAIDGNANQVLVWERYDGGAGVSETIRESVRSDATQLYRELLASALCPISLDEDRSWTDPRVLKQRLANDWLLPDDDRFLDLLVSEAQAERQAARLQQERAREGRVSCADGCPVCIQVTSCTARNAQGFTTSRAVAEAIIRCLRRHVDGTELQDLIEQSIRQDIITPPVLFNDPDREESDVLLL